MGSRGFITTLFFVFTIALIWDGKQKRSAYLNTNTLEKPSDEWWRMQLADPETGEIPGNIRSRDLDFISSNFSTGNRSAGELKWENIGPYNIGGRTRALVVDRSNPTTILAGSASGGIYRSEDEGTTWTKVTTNEHNISISWIHQDPRTGKENMWYACTGEARGASQGAPNFSAHFGGDGVLVSSDHGKTWNRLGTFINDSPQKQDSLDLSWKILVDNQSVSTVLLLATPSGIFRTENEGNTWTKVFGPGGGDQYIDLVQTSSGIWYATVNGAFGGNNGLYRSADGRTFKHIRSPRTNLGRGVIGLNHQNENTMYLLFESPGSGQKSEFLGRNGYHSLFKYTYISGDGSGTGGKWEDLSQNLPKGIWPFDDYHSQTGYCMDIKVSPYDSNTVALAGVNLNISHNGFRTPNESKFAGGYYHKLDTPFYQIYPNHHPDVQIIAFHPTEPKTLLTGSDGGIHLCRDLYAKHVVWESLNNGYVTTQFYTVAVDKQQGSRKVIGGLQDNGTLYYLADSLGTWSMPVDYDGAYCHFLNYSPYFLAAKQQAGLFKVSVDADGNKMGFARIDPATSNNYLFINPYTIDPNNNRILYLPNGNALWRNSDISQFEIDNQYKRQTKNWEQLNISGVSGVISAVAVSKTPANVLYFGTSGGGIVRVDSANSNYKATDISISNVAGFVSSIAIHPKNADYAVAVFSNYNIYSVFCTYDGGENWSNISGNMEGEIQSGIPPQFAQINDGPSCRVAKFIELEDTTWLLLGTSVGLFGTLNLDSMNTKWEPVSQEEIGTNVVTAIDYRPGDGYLAVATHGQGVFSTYVTSGESIGISKNETNRTKLVVFPNPTSNQIHIQLPDRGSLENMEIRVFNSSGKVVLLDWIKSSSLTANLEGVNPGIYFISVQVDGNTYLSRFVKI